ncbi:MAG TPA: wax ester/triacylglycerol synthase domain-containing protein [Acidimicrobiales bacterium]|nr:wax ester/triacylglycerol synthase domain-containing protein [Acidimicrobiales bacterium]
MEDRHLTDVEALLWTLDADPHLSSTFANVTLLDRPPDAERFRARMAHALRVIPRLRRRVEGGMAGLAAPSWVEDPDVDLDHHVRRVTLDQPGDLDQLLALATDIAGAPFARDRPLWEFVIVDGLADGRGAMVQKLHHTITDGEGGVRMSVQFIDLERDAEAPPAPPRPEPEAEAGPEATRPFDAVVGPLAELARAPLGLARQAVEGAAGLVGDPSRLVTLPGDAAATARSLARQLGVTGEALSPLWRERTLERRLELLRVPLAEAKAAATALGGSVNDLFVAGAAGGAGAYHRAVGTPVEELRMAMPISTRSDRSAAGNAFAPTRVRVPVDEDPRDRFRAVHQRLAVTKEERAVGLTGAVAGLGNLLPAPVLVRLVRQQTATVDFTTSNVRGAPFPLYIAGARIEANHPIGPLGGTAWNLTTISVDGSLDMGLHVDTGAVADPALLRAGIEAAFDELLALT